ncbi:cornifelin homolog [Ranitomeya variabilis]|uniref:cornifelin homolog n=1 Tax=Ranitomeya variabilis TaxID=490064 RepID=UPI004056A6B5
MEAVISQPGVITTQTVTISQSPRWGSDLCDCCDDCGICCCAMWCFPCMQCDTASDFGECLCLPLLDARLMGYLWCCGICPPVTIAMRAAIRERYKIPGSICNDCVLSCCCYTCTWCQIAREIKVRSQTSSITTAHTTLISNAPIIPQAHGYAPIVEY